MSDGIGRERKKMIKYMVICDVGQGREREKK